MNISGIRPSDGFYEKNTNKLLSDSISPVSEGNQTSEIKPSVSGRDGDIAASLTISNAGRLAARNIERAVNSMEKDTSIHRYQYFVQNQKATASGESKGLENFSL